MNTSIRTVRFTSDGLLVEFEEGTHCYYPASFLYQQSAHECNQVFLNYDPSESTPDLPLGLRQQEQYATSVSGTLRD